MGVTASEPTAQVRKILVVEDEMRGARLLEVVLSELGADIEVVGSGSAALNQLAESDFDLITIDIGLPDISGLSLLRSVRELSGAPVIMVTAADEIKLLEEALDAGADDYIVKPFHPRELLARAGAVLRRTLASARPPKIYSDGTIVIDFSRGEVVTPRGVARLSPTEVRLLAELVANAGRPLTHDELLRRVWGLGYEETTENLQVYIGYVRRKVEPDPKNPRYIRTIRGVGYEFEPDGGGRSPAPSAG